MKVEQCEPEVSYVWVTVSGVPYKGETVTIEVNCAVDGSCMSAHHNDPLLVCGYSFWNNAFGRKPAKQLERICRKAVKAFIAKEGG